MRRCGRLLRGDNPVSTQESEVRSFLHTALAPLAAPHDSLTRRGKFDQMIQNTHVEGPHIITSSNFPSHVQSSGPQFRKIATQPNLLGLALQCKCWSDGETHRNKKRKKIRGTFAVLLFQTESSRLIQLPVKRGCGEPQASGFAHSPSFPLVVVGPLLLPASNEVKRPRVKISRL